MFVDMISTNRRAELELFFVRDVDNYIEKGKKFMFIMFKVMSYIE